MYFKLHNLNLNYDEKEFFSSVVLYMYHRTLLSDDITMISAMIMLMRPYQLWYVKMNMIFIRSLFYLNITFIWNKVSIRQNGHIYRIFDLIIFYYL